MMFPWGIYSYLRLPIGIACSPDVFQFEISTQNVAMGLIHAFIDDLLFILSVKKMDRKQQSDTVLVLKGVMVIHFKKYFLCLFYEPSMKKKFALSKAVFYHTWKTKHGKNVLKRGGLIEVRIWSSWFVQIGKRSPFLIATPRSLNICSNRSDVCDTIPYINFLMAGLKLLCNSRF
jgi:hypothetical protein